MTISEKEIIEQKLFSDTSQYNDIMDQEWSRPANRLPLTPADRAGQFAPFAALTGFGKLINQTSKIYQNKDYLSATTSKLIQEQLGKLAKTHEVATFNYFDDESGYYVDFTDKITVIKPERGRVFFNTHLSVPIANIRYISRTPKGMNNK